MMLQQGDVLLVKTNAVGVAGKAVEPTERGFILAEGEVTGHAHVLECLPGTTLFADGEIMTLHVEKDSNLAHEEHGHIMVPAGDYAVRKVREYDHLAEETRLVQD